MNTDALAAAAEPRPTSCPGTAPDHRPFSDVAVVRTGAGWAVVSPEGAEGVADLVEGLCLADLVTEQFGGSVDPDRSARRSARGPAVTQEPVEDPRDARLAALERTVSQLEHALAARVSTERAIGVLAERHATSPRQAFESLRQAARSQGRAVAELAREVLETLSGADAAPLAASGPPAPRTVSGLHRSSAHVPDDRP